MGGLGMGHLARAVDGIVVKLAARRQRGARVRDRCRVRIGADTTQQYQDSRCPERYSPRLGRPCGRRTLALRLISSVLATGAHDAPATVYHSGVSHL